MALSKYLGSRLDQISGTTHRRPAWRVVIYNPRQTTVQDVARGVWRGVQLDVSTWCSSITVRQNQVFENSSDAIASRAALTFEIDDSSGALVGGYRIKIDQRLFRDGTPIQIFEGDRRVVRSDFIPVFTGIIRGNPSANTAQRGRRRLQVSCFGRAQMFQRQEIVGINWDYGTDLGTMAVDVAMIEMGLSREEIRFGEFGRTTRHKANALTQIGKMQGLYEIMKVVERKPYFDAEGLLVSHDTSVFKPPVFSVGPKSVQSISRVQQLGQFVNSTEVIGLDYRMTKVGSPMTPVAEVSTTVGFFDSSYRERIYYSKDRTRRVENTSIKVETASTMSLGSSVTWNEIDEFSGKLKINTGYAPELIGTIALLNTVLASLEASLTIFIDALQSGANAVLGGIGSIFTGISEAVAIEIRFYTQLAMAATNAAIQYLLTTWGRFSITIYGEPFEHVHQELRAIAAMKDATTADTFERKEVMHWVDDIETAKAIAKNMLRREQIKSQEYEVRMPSIPALEVDDIIEIDTGGRFGFARPARFYVIGIQRDYQRGPEDAIMSLRCWHCLEAPEVSA